MKFKHLFYDNTIDFRKISKRRLFTSIIIGLLSSFSIYCTFYVLREGFRLMSFGYEPIPLIFTENGRWLSNLFYAYLSLIFGNSITLSLLFSFPQKILSRRNNNRRKIINEQIFLNLNFLFWFSQIAFTS